MAEKLDGIIGKYVQLRDRRTALKANYVKEDADLKKMMAKIEQWLQKELDSQGLESVSTVEGTAYRTYNEYANVADWPSLLSYIRENEQWGLLERRVSKSTVKELMLPDANNKYTAPPPPGVNFTREETIQIRRR